MKKIFKLFLLSSVILSSQGTFAQSDSVTEKKNIIKLNLSSLIFSNFSFQYERVLSRRTSIALGVSIMPETGLPFADNLQEQYGANSDAAKAIADTKLSNFSITPEFRFYLGKKGAPRGLYLAPFARYNRLKFDQVYKFKANDNTDHVANIKGTINNIGGGLLLGTQWMLGKSITLDWWIAGPIYGSSNGTLSGTDAKGIPVADRAKIKDDIEDTDIPGTTLQATVGANQIDVVTKGGYFGLRAFGFALGFRF